MKEQNKTAKIKEIIQPYNKKIKKKKKKNYEGGDTNSSNISDQINSMRCYKFSDEHFLTLDFLKNF